MCKVGFKDLSGLQDLTGLGFQNHLPKPIPQCQATLHTPWPKGGASKFWVTRTQTCQVSKNLTGLARRVVEPQNVTHTHAKGAKDEGQTTKEG